MQRQRYQVPRPWTSNRERLLDEALAVHTVPAHEVRGYQPTPRDLFPDRYGYDSRQLTLAEVLMLDPTPGAEEIPVRDTKEGFAAGSQGRKSSYYRAYSSGSFTGTSRPSGSGIW